MVVYPYYLGKAPLTREQFMQTARNLTFPFYALKPVWPMASGGIYPSLIPRMMEDLGTEVMIGAGGGVHAHPMGPLAGARAFRQAIDAVMAGRPLEETAAEHPELRVALETWRDPYKEMALSGNGHQ
jgi:2,3-diketo-5-methylthiopentyl-1-phosphate enolase